MFKSQLCVLRAKEGDLTARIIYPSDLVDERSSVKTWSIEHVANSFRVHEVNPIDDEPETRRFCLWIVVVGFKTLCKEVLEDVKVKFLEEILGDYLLEGFLLVK